MLSPRSKRKTTHMPTSKAVLPSLRFKTVHSTATGWTMRPWYPEKCFFFEKDYFFSCGGCGRISAVVCYQFRENYDSVVWHAYMAYGIISTKNFIYVQRTMHKYSSEYYNSKHFEVISPGLVVMWRRHGNRIIYACKKFIDKSWENRRRTGTFAEFLDQVKLCQPSKERRED